MPKAKAKAKAKANDNDNNLSLLPPVYGPKLGPFQFKDEHSYIQWMERLDDANDEDETDYCRQSYIFHVKIDNKDYTIKVFKFYDPMSDELFWGPICQNRLPLTKISHYLDPFYAECRAYGRLKEMKKQKRLKHNITVPCHGYILLEGEDIHALQQRNIRFEVPNPSYQSTTIEQFQPRAIVMEWVKSLDSGLNLERLKKALKGVHELNKTAMIYNQGIRMANFCDGRIMSFGSACTIPSEIFNRLGNNGRERCKLNDRVRLQQMVMEGPWATDEKRRVPKLHCMQRRSDGPIQGSPVEC